HFLIDSLAQLDLVLGEASRHTLTRPLTALVELGLPGGRTGARTHAEALALARAISTTSVVQLTGVECYEGLKITGDAAEDALHVGELMRNVKELALACDREGRFAGATIILSAGGSAVFDIVARDLHTRLSRPVQTILRSGCYVAHDSGFYERMLQAVKLPTGGQWKTRPGLKPALEVWAQVQSRPEPTLAILTMGRRDASYDLDLPGAMLWYRAGKHSRPEATAPDWRITKLNDQHAYLDVPSKADLQVGDLVA